MKKSTDWGTRISLLLIVFACVAIAWRLSPTSLPQRDPVEATQSPHLLAATPADSGRDPARSPLEALVQLAHSPALAVPPDAGTHPSQWSYRLDAPDHSYALPPSLDQVSDLAATADTKGLWAVTDEKGTVHRIAIEDGTVTQSIDFGPPGAYEGVAQVDGGVIVARSDGLLFMVDVEDGGTSTVKTNLSPDCNLEGLAYDPYRRRLLLACKSAMPKMPHSRKSVGIYAMTLDTRKVQGQPVIVIPRQAIDDYVGTHPDQPELKPNMGDEFAPKAMAVHPLSGQIFLLSARGTMLVVLKPTGTLQRVEGLDPLLHPQPEGIAFGADGTLYLSNKSRGARAHVLSYAQLRPLE